MTLRYLKSALADALIADYVAAVQKYATEKKAWLNHMAFVEAEKNFPLKEPEAADYADRAAFDAALKEYVAAIFQRHAPYQAPFAHPAVMAAVNAEGDLDLEIIDDVSINDTGARTPTGQDK
jgi:hypothetical protein